MDDKRPALEIVREDIEQDLSTISNLTNRTAVQMNIDWINEHMGGAPIAVSLVLMDILPLFQDRAATLNGQQN